jgi:hypothetical protein
MITRRKSSALAWWLNLARHHRRGQLPLRANLAAWYRADRGVVADSAKSISQWQDQSGNNRHLLQSTGAAQPLLTRADNCGNLLLWSADPTQNIWEKTSPVCTFDLGLEGPVASDHHAFRVNNFDGVLNDVRFLQYLLLNLSLADRQFVVRCWVKGEGTNIGKDVRIRLTRVTGTAYQVASTVTLTGDWQQITLPTFTGLADTVGLYLAMSSLATNCANSFLAYGLQISEPNWDTTYIPTTSYPQPAGLHGWPTLLFNGTSHFLKTDAFTLNQPETIYLVFRLKSGSDDRHFFDGQTIYSFRGYRRTGVITWRINAGATLDLVAPPAVNSWAILGIIANGTESRLTINGLTVVTGNLGANNAGGFTLSAVADGGTPANIQVGEILLYGAAHDENARLRIARYLANKWGITL